jgi:hypothetical protein
MRHLRENHIHFSGWINGDIELNLLLMLYGNVGFINEVVYVTRQHENNASIMFNDSKGLGRMYLDIYKYIYDKALLVLKDKKVLATWLKKLIDKNIMICLHTILAKNEREQMNLFNRFLFREYKKEYVFFLIRHPRYIVKVILNK